MYGVMFGSEWVKYTRKLYSSNFFFLNHPGNVFQCSLTTIVKLTVDLQNTRIPVSYIYCKITKMLGGLWSLSSDNSNPVE